MTVTLAEIGVKLPSAPVTPSRDPPPPSCATARPGASATSAAATNRPFLPETRIPSLQPATFPADPTIRAPARN